MTDREKAPVGESGLIWCEPPPANGGTGNRGAANDRIVAELREHPGRWALVKEGASHSYGRAYRKRGCETAVRKREDGKWDVWARWPEAAS